MATGTKHGNQFGSVTAHELLGRRGVKRRDCDSAADKYASPGELLGTTRAGRRFRRDLDAAFVSIVNAIIVTVREALVWSDGGDQCVDVANYDACDYPSKYQCYTSTSLHKVLEHVRAVLYHTGHAPLRVVLVVREP